MNATLPGRRGSPPDPKNGIPPLAVYSPIHYQELPELLMDFICSLTGKVAFDDGFRQRRGAHEAALQRAASGDRREQCPGFHGGNGATPGLRRRRDLSGRTSG